MSTRALRLDPKDGRPASAFGVDWLDGVSIAGGLASSVLMPLAFLALAGMAALLSWLIKLFLIVVLGMQPASAADDRESILEEEDVIEARFVRLGRDFEEELPNREVHVLSTAPPEPSEVPREDTPVVEQPVQRIEDRPPNTVENLLTRLDQRAEIFEEMMDRPELEGDPEGEEDGSESQEGNRYAGRFASFFRRGWTVPTTLSRDEIRELAVDIDVTIGPELQIVRFAIRRSSGNPLFDDSAIQQLTRLQASDARIPPPPEEEADTYIDRTVGVRFRGRDAR